MSERTKKFIGVPYNTKREARTSKAAILSKIQAYEEWLNELTVINRQDGFDKSLREVRGWQEIQILSTIENLRKQI